MPRSTPGPPGFFRFDRASDTWTWSASAFALYGLDPDVDQPSLVLMASLTHPEDRAALVSVLTTAQETGKPSSVVHRLVAEGVAMREVVTTVAGRFDDEGGLLGLSGQVVDVTEHVRTSTAREVREALESLAQSRPLIEQAKGALMMTYAIDADRAFRLLRSYSQQQNVKTRDIARLLVASMSTMGGLPVDVRRSLDRLVAAVPEPLLGENRGA